MEVRREAIFSSSARQSFRSGGGGCGTLGQTDLVMGDLSPLVVEDKELTALWDQVDVSGGNRAVGAFQKLVQWPWEPAGESGASGSEEEPSTQEFVPMVRHTSTAPGQENLRSEASPRQKDPLRLGDLVRRVEDRCQPDGTPVVDLLLGARQTMSPGLPMKPKRRPPKGTTMRDLLGVGDVPRVRGGESGLGG